MLILLASVLIVSGGIVLFGMRGKTIDDHPVCRRCGFDLTGKPPGSARCGECGADLNRKRAVRIGHRRRRTIVVAIGLVLFLVSGGYTGVTVWNNSQDIDWLHYAPLGMVLSRASSSSDYSRREEAFHELSDRAAAGKLKPAQWDAIAKAATAADSQPDATWEGHWGRLLKMPEARNQITPAVWNAYTDELVRQMSSRDPVRLRNASDDVTALTEPNAMTRQQWDAAADAALANISDRSHVLDQAALQFLIVARRAKHVDDPRWDRHVGELITQAMSTDSLRAGPATMALDGCLFADPRGWDPLIRAVLALQADQSRPWNAHWGDLVEMQHISGGMRGPQWTKYLQQSVAGAIRLDLADEITEGNPLPFRLTISPLRSGSYEVVTLGLSRFFQQWPGFPEVTAEPTQFEPVRAGNFPNALSGQLAWSRLAVKPKPGDQRLELVIWVKAGSRGQGGEPDQAESVNRVVLPGTFTVLAKRPSATKQAG
jgi:hypothetical protein